MERTHYLKLDEVYCEPVYHGDKTFEVRYNDRGYQKGDYINFIPVDKIGEINHPIGKRLYKITYIHSGLGLEKMYVVLGIKLVKREEE